MRFAIYGDELLFCEALSSLLEQRGHVVVACETDDEQLFGKVASCGPEVCLVVLHSPDPDVESLLQRVRAAAAMLPIVLLTGELAVSFLWRLIDSGADGLCVKADGIEEIEDVVRRCATRRGTTDEPSVWSASALSWARRAPRLSESVKLTPKERAVLEHLVQGSSTTKIAAELGVRDATVRTHLQHLFTKFGVHSRLALVACAVRSDVVTIGREQIATARNP